MTNESDEVSDAQQPLLIREYAFLTPQMFGPSYEHACSVAGVEPIEGGYGMLFSVDQTGARWTSLTDDPAYIDLMKLGVGSGVLAGLRIPQEKFPIMRAGWPDEWV